MMARKCDCCGSYYTWDECKIKYVQILLKNTYSVSSEWIDLCPKCMGVVFNMVKGRLEREKNE